MALTGSMRIELDLVHTSALDLSTPADHLTHVKSHNIASGTGDDQADQVFHDVRTLGAGASEELDLAGVLTDAFGDALTMVEVRHLIVEADEDNGDDILVGGAATNGFISPFGDATDVVKVKPGGRIILSAPKNGAYAVVAGTGDKLQIENADGAAGADYTIIIVAASA